MNAERQRIVIAELRGWTLCQPRASHTGLPWISGMNPKPDEILLVVECGTGIARKPNESDYGFETLPDYLNDLNACHEFEESLTSVQYWQFIEWLRNLVCIRRVPYVADRASATAAQRCEAFLRTVGKWEDGE